MPVGKCRRRRDGVMQGPLLVTVDVRTEALARQVADQPEPVLRFLAGIVVAAPPGALMRGLQRDSLGKVVQLGSV